MSWTRNISIGILILAVIVGVKVAGNLADDDRQIIIPDEKDETLYGPSQDSSKDKFVEYKFENSSPELTSVSNDKEKQEMNQDSGKCDEVGTALIDSFFSKPCYNENELELLIHKKINEQRAKFNLQPLTFDNNLEQIAKSHSQDMANRDYFSHPSLEGKKFWDRYSQAEYHCEIVIGNTIYGGGENIAQNALYDQYSSSAFGRSITEWKTPEKIAYGVVAGESPDKGWMNSEGHKKNILESFWKSEGIGVSIDEQGLVFVTQNFC